MNYWSLWLFPSISLNFWTKEIKTRSYIKLLSYNVPMKENLIWSDKNTRKLLLCCRVEIHFPLPVSDQPFRYCGCLESDQEVEIQSICLELSLNHKHTMPIVQCGKSLLWTPVFHILLLIKSRLLCTWVRIMCMHLGKQNIRAQVLWSLTPMWEIQMDSWLLVLDCVAYERIWGVKEQMKFFSLCVSFCLNLPLSVSLCLETLNHSVCTWELHHTIFHLYFKFYLVSLSIELQHRLTLSYSPYQLGSLCDPKAL